MAQRAKADLMGSIRSAFKENEVKSVEAIDYNTFKITMVNGDIHYRFHDTNVLTKRKNELIFRTGGFWTVSTLSRIRLGLSDLKIPIQFNLFGIYSKDQNKPYGFEINGKQYIGVVAISYNIGRKTVKDESGPYYKIVPKHESKTP
jgi:hypothetical protein